MRETRFRGKDEESRKWVYGYPIKAIYRQIGERVEIIPEINFEKDVDHAGYVESIPVDPDTVGQGVCIDDEWYYEGDIFWDGENEEYCVLVWDGMGFVLEREGGIIAVDDFCWLRKVGNVWDSLELVEWYSHES